jgi:DNA-binding beta-propeller fold protein YncE
MIIFISIAVVIFIAACGFFDPFQISGLKRYAYVVNNAAADESVSTFSIGINGALTRQGSSIATGNNPYRIAATHDGTFLYVTNWDSNNVSAYSIGPQGVLAAVPGSPFPAGTGPGGIAITHNNSFLYVTNEGGTNVSQYSIGFVSPRAGVVSPDNSYLYTVNNGGGNISALKINGDGTLEETAGSPFGVCTLPKDIAITQDGSYLYATSTDDNNVYAFSTAADGSLAEITG